MKTQNLKWTVILVGCAMLAFLSCNKSEEPMGTGEAEFQITDAPVDDANIKSVFITIADVKVDGQSIPEFNKQTINLKAYQEGITKVLGTTQLNAKAYSSLTLVLDADMDANGNAPGCYVQTSDDSKFKLRSNGTIEVTINKSWNVLSNSKSTIVVDVDLRKAIRMMTDNAIRYNFVSDDNLSTAVRLVMKDKVGAVSGSYSDQFGTNADKIIVYVYKKGSFNASTEAQAQGEDAIFFKNAVTSAEVKEGLASKTFILAFLEDGEYELHFVTYKKETIGDEFVLQSMLKSETAVGGKPGDFISVHAGMSLEISSVITGTI